MIDKDKIEEAEKAAKKAAKDLFRELSPEEQKALTDLKTIGSPKNLSEPTSEDEDQCDS